MTKPQRLADVRLIAVDLDGTLLTREKTISPRTLEAVEACRRRGILLAFATGRSQLHAAAYLKQLRPDAAVLAYGAQVMIGGETVFRRCMMPAVATKVLRGVGMAAKIRYQLPDGTCYLTEPDGESLPLDRKAPIDGRVEHLCAWDVPAKTAAELARSAGCSLSQVVGDRWCNFSARGVNKGAGMRRLMRALGLQPGQAVAFGDESCDIDFFRACGFGVAMDNADPQTLAAADARTGSNDRDGIADFLENWVLP